MWFLSAEIFDPLQTFHFMVWALCLLFPPHNFKVWPQEMLMFTITKGAVIHIYHHTVVKSSWHMLILALNNFWVLAAGSLFGPTTIFGTLLFQPYIILFKCIWKGITHVCMCGCMCMHMCMFNWLHLLYCDLVPITSLCTLSTVSKPTLNSSCSCITIPYCLVQYKQYKER
jgi:hypothetical protein